MSRVLDETHQSLLCVEEDLNYCNAILDGSWPSAVEILERALLRAKEKTQAHEQT